jgi:hypothetical protein
MSQVFRSIVAPLAALAAGPAAWVVQLVAGYAVSSLSCFPHDAPAASAPGPGEHAVLMTLNLACVLMALLGLAAAYLSWRGAGPGKVAGHADIMPARLGRARFLGACGILSGAIFCVAILFDTANVLGAPACWSLIR